MFPPPPPPLPTPMNVHEFLWCFFYCSYWQRISEEKETRYYNVFTLLSKRTSLVLDRNLKRQFSLVIHKWGFMKNCVICHS